MSEIFGTVHKSSVIDFHQRCASCGKVFYFSHDCNGKAVICPHCGHRH